MNTSVTVQDKNISLQIRENAIKIFNDDALTKMLATNAEAATQELITSIKTEYLKLFKSDFKVSDASIAIEIWAHVYVEKFAVAVESFTSIKLIDKLAKKIIEHCAVIDIGEHGHDDNRFVWDGLAPLKSAIAGVLFKEETK